VPAQAAQERAPSSHRDRVWQFERHPAAGPFDVGAASPVSLPVEVQERLPAHVENAGSFLDHAGPVADLGEELGQVVEQVGWAMRHGSVVPSIVQVESGLAGAARWAPAANMRGHREPRRGVEAAEADGAPSRRTAA
jgi:hypothetical protein